MKKPYPKYKASPIEWLEQLPEHWEVRRLKYVSKLLFSNVDKHTIENEKEIFLCNYLDVYRNDFIIKSLPFMKATASKGEIDKFTLQKDDVLATKDSETPKDIAVPALVVENLENVLCGYHLALIRVNQYKLKGAYLFRLLQSKNINAHFETSANGITRYGLSIDAFNGFLLSVPPLPEQTQIARFLDHKCALIDTAIQKKTRLIELLKEQKQAIINRAVTRGLDPNAPMRDSGIEWLGEIPAHWEVKKLKYLGSSFIGITYNPTELTDEANGILVLRSSNIQDGELDFTDSVYVKREKDIPEKQITRAHDILICSRNGSAKLVGKNVSIEGKAIGQTFGAFMTIFRSINNSYLKVIFDSELFSSQTGLFSTSTINQLTKNILENIQVPFPVEFEEREKIISYIQEEVNKVELTISRIEREIELIKEYKTALIAEAVTGKIDVREWKPKNEITKQPDYVANL